MSQKGAVLKSKQQFERITKKGPVVKSTAFAKNTFIIANNAGIASAKEQNRYARSSMSTS